MQLRLIARAWRQNKKRSRLAVMTVTLAAGLMATLFALSLGISEKMSRELKHYGANIRITSVGQALLPEVLKDQVQNNAQALLAEDALKKIKDIFWAHNIVAFAPVFETEAEVAGERIAVLGTFFDQPLPLEDDPEFRTGHQYMSPFWQVTGAWPQADKPQVLIGSKLASHYGWQIGQELQLKGQENFAVTISGILSNGQDEQRIVMPLIWAQRLAGQPHKIQQILVSALTTPEDKLSAKARRNLDDLDSEEYDRWFCTAYASSISHQLEDMIYGSVAQPIWQIAASEGAIIQKIQMLLLVVTLAALFTGSMGIAALVRNAIAERYQEIGLMKALGAHAWKIEVLFYADAILSSLVGGLLGCLLGFGLAQLIALMLFGSQLVFAWILIPCVLFFALAIAVCGTRYAIRSIDSLNPIEVLYGSK